MPVVAAGFEQQHAVPARGGQAIGEHAAGGARADDDVVEGIRIAVLPFLFLSGKDYSIKPSGPSIRWTAMRLRWVGVGWAFWLHCGMQFGIFGSAQASTADLGPETGQGFRDYLDYGVEAEALGYRSSFLVEHHFTGWNQVSATLMLQTALAMRTTRAAARHRRDRAALAQSGAARRAGGDARPDLRRPARFRHRQGLPAQRVRGLPHSAGGGRGALRGIGRGDDQGVRVARALLASRPVLAVRRHRGRAAAGAEAASAVLGRGRQRGLDPPRRGARLQSDPRPVRLAASSSASASRSTAPSGGERPCRSIRCRSRSRASLCRQGQGRGGGGAEARSAVHPAHGRRVARAGRATPARMCCPMPATRGRTEAHALYGTPDEISSQSSKRCSRPASSISC